MMKVAVGAARTTPDQHRAARARPTAHFGDRIRDLREGATAAPPDDRDHLHPAAWGRRTGPDTCTNSSTSPSGEWSGEAVTRGAGGRDPPRQRRVQARLSPRSVVD